MVFLGRYLITLPAVVKIIKTSRPAKIPVNEVFAPPAAWVFDLGRLPNAGKPFINPESKLTVPKANRTLSPEG